jgi:hypothetical protein
MSGAADRCRDSVVMDLLSERHDMPAIFQGISDSAKVKKSCRSHACAVHTVKHGGSARGMYSLPFEHPGPLYLPQLTKGHL